MLKTSLAILARNVPTGIELLSKRVAVVIKKDPSENLSALQQKSIRFQIINDVVNALHAEQNYYSTTILSNEVSRKKLENESLECLINKERILLEKKLKELEERMSRVEESVRSRFSLLCPLLLMLAKEKNANSTLALAYGTNPVTAFKSDVHVKISFVLAELQVAVWKDRFQLAQHEKASVIAAIANLPKRRLQLVISRYAHLALWKKRLAEKYSTHWTSIRLNELLKEQARITVFVAECQVALEFLHETEKKLGLFSLRESLVANARSAGFALRD